MYLRAFIMSFGPAATDAVCAMLKNIDKLSRRQLPYQSRMAHRRRSNMAKANNVLIEIGQRALSGARSVAHVARIAKASANHLAASCRAHGDVPPT